MLVVNSFAFLGSQLAKTHTRLNSLTFVGGLAAGMICYYIQINEQKIKRNTQVTILNSFQKPQLAEKVRR